MRCHCLTLTSLEMTKSIQNKNKINPLEKPDRNLTDQRNVATQFGIFQGVSWIHKFCEHQLIWHWKFPLKAQKLKQALS